MTTSVAELNLLFKARRGAPGVVEVPEAGYVCVDGTGSPDGADFADAVQALYAVSYGAHFLVKKERGDAPKVMPLEGLWWGEDPALRSWAEAVAAGEAAMGDGDRTRWLWRAMIMQPDPIDAEAVARAVDQARAKKSLPALDRLRFERWQEGLCMQVMHVGPYAEEARSIVLLHEAIAAAGYRPRGHHHEIYLGDPRRSAPQKLRTILRQPVEPRESP
jgi:hypothetical protein